MSDLTDQAIEAAARAFTDAHNNAVDRDYEYGIPFVSDDDQTAAIAGMQAAAPIIEAAAMRRIEQQLDEGDLGGLLVNPALKVMLQARADRVRAKVAEDIARAIASEDGGEYGCCGCPKDRDRHAGIARAHAVRLPGTAQDATTAPDAYPTKGPGVTDAQSAAERESQP